MSVLFIVFLFLAAASSSGLAYAYHFPVLYGILAGSGIALLAPVLALLPGKTGIVRSMEWLTQIIMVTVSVTVVLHTLQLIAEATPATPDRTLPLLLAIVALYIFYILTGRISLSTSSDLVPQRLTAVFSGPPLILTLAMAAIITSYILVAIHHLQLSVPDWSFITKKFLDRGIIPPLTVLLFVWGLLMLINKAWTLWLENRLQLSLTKSNRSILVQTYRQVMADGNTGHMQPYFDLLWKKSSDFYIIPRYINWAIPILGFIGTVLGISLAADGIQNIIGSSQGLGQLSSQLGSAIAPLGIAFDTTLIALSLSVFLMLLQTILQRWEDSILVDYENRIRNMLVAGQ